MAIQVNPLLSPRIITIPETDGTSITVQSLVNQCRDWEDEQVNMSYPPLIRATGKDELGESLKVGITAVLENALIKAEERTAPTIFSVSGGNILAEDINGYKVFPFAPSTNVSYDRAKSSSATLIVGGSALTSEEHSKLMDVLVTSDRDVIIDGVWDELIVNHSPENSFGESINRIKGLSQENYRISNTVYDSKNNMTSATLKIYRDATNCNNDTNSMATYSITATYNENNKVTSYKVVVN